MAKSVLAGPCADCGEFEASYFGSHPTLCRACEPVNPRWRDWHTLPDEWLIKRLRYWMAKRPSNRLKRAVARYALRHLHCDHDGQCIFRAHHRGGCDWGNDDE